MTVPTLVEGVNAISARVVKKDGKITLFVLNLTNQAVPFNINIDSAEVIGSFTHKL